MNIMHKVNSYSRTRHSRKSGNPGTNWIPPHQVRGRLSQARNDKPDNVCGVMHKKNFLLKNQSGAALVIALIMMIIFTLIGLASIFTSTFEMKISGNKKGSTNAFYRADGGIQVVTAAVANFSATTHTYPYDPFTDTVNNPINPTNASANITYVTAMLGAPRGLGVSATNFEFQHYLVRSTGRDQTDLSINPSTCIIQEKVVRLIPTEQGGRE